MTFQEIADAGPATGEERGLIAHYLELDPAFSAPSEARLSGYGVPVWAIIGYLQHAVNNDLDAVARDYDVPIPAVQAAVAYYTLHDAAIDARIRLNQSAR